MKQNLCEACGSAQLEKIGDSYKCKSCGATWRADTVDTVAAKLSSIMDELKQEKLANARSNLYNATHQQFLSSAEIGKWATEILEHYPDDFLAGFYKVALSSDHNKINNYLASLDVTQCADYLDIVLPFLFRTMERENLLAVSDLISRAYEPTNPKHTQYQTQFEKEAEKINSELYDETCPRDVFVAYKSEDMSSVMKLVEYLERNGLECFVSARNLRHGKDAVGSYDDKLKAAIDNCRVVVFVSSNKSRTTGDARYKELPYIRQKDIDNAPSQYRALGDYTKIPAMYKKGRVEYLVEKYKGFANERFVEQFFDGLNWATSPEQVYNAIDDIYNRPLPNEQDTAATQAPQVAVEPPQVKQPQPVEQPQVKQPKKVEKQVDKQPKKAQKPPLTPQSDAITPTNYDKAVFHIVDTTLLKYTGANEGEVRIPHGVTTIGAKAFENCTNVTSVIIPDTVTAIENYAFHCCRSITSVTIPEGVSEISVHTFDNCSALAKVELPQSLTKIDECAFCYCNRLMEVHYLGEIEDWCQINFNSGYSGTNPLEYARSLYVHDQRVTDLVISGNVDKICANAFKGYGGLKTVTVEEGVTQIDNAVFANCENLVSVSLPDSLIDMGAYLFNNCKNLINFTIPSGVRNIPSSCFRRCKGLKSVVIPYGVTTIDPCAFDHCQSLTSITIPNSVHYICDNAFADCTDLRYVTISKRFGKGLKLKLKKIFKGCYNISFTFTE